MSGVFLPPCSRISLVTALVSPTGGDGCESYLASLDSAVDLIIIFIISYLHGATTSQRT